MGLNDIIAERPGKKASNREKTKYNALVYDGFLNGEYENEALHELVSFNEGYILKLVSKSSFCKTYNLCTFDDVYSTFICEFMNVLKSKKYKKWSPSIFYKAMDQTKDSIHEQYASGGFSGLGTNRRSKYRRIAEDELVVFDSEPEDTLVSVVSKEREYDPEEHLQSENQKAAVTKIFESCAINDTHKEIILAHCGEEESYKSIATRYCMTESNVRQIVSRGLKQLKMVAYDLVTEDELEDLLPL